MNEISEMELEVMAAERAVDDARNKLVADLEAVSETGREALARVVHRARPLAIVGAVVVGVAVLAGAVALVRGSFSRSRASSLRSLVAPQQRSLLGQLARQALTSAANTVAVAVARRAILSLEMPAAPPALEAPESNSRANGQAPKRARSKEVPSAG